MRRTFNKAGYTATSCGRVGRSGNARFHTFQLMLTDGRTDGQTDGRTDKASYRVACLQLKMIFSRSWGSWGNYEKSSLWGKRFEIRPFIQ